MMKRNHAHLNPKMFYRLTITMDQK